MILLLFHSLFLLCLCYLTVSAFFSSSFFYILHRLYGSHIFWGIVCAHRSSRTFSFSLFAMEWFFAEHSLFKMIRLPGLVNLLHALKKKKRRKFWKKFLLISIFRSFHPLFFLFDVFFVLRSMVRTHSTLLFVLFFSLLCKNASTWLLSLGIWTIQITTMPELWYQWKTMELCMWN